jgi:hypothetical protein
VEKGQGGEGRGGKGPVIWWLCNCPLKYSTIILKRARKRFCMLNYNELLNEINRLSLEERLSLLEALSHSLREEFSKNTGQKASPSTKVRGIARPEGSAPTDEEIKEDYTDYLLKKYN